MKDSFRLWFPAEIEKAQDPNGGNQMILKGIASTEDWDDDQEQVVTKGLDISFLKERGFINWHHQMKNNPAAVIGEPLEVKTTNKGLFVKGLLYDSEVGREAYKLAETLQKGSKTRRLGWSLEGKMVKSDGMGKITKARVTNLALTPLPKNKNTFAEITKALVDGEIEEDKLFDSTDLMKEAPADVYIEKGDGTTIQITGGRIKIIEKAIDTTDDAALIKEDLEGGDTAKRSKVKKKNANGGTVTKGTLSDDEAINKVLQLKPGYTRNMAEKIVGLIKKGII